MIYDVEFNSSTQYPAPSVVELAEVAEARGFTAFWEGEANNMDPMVLLSAIAARTRTLQLGTAIYHVFGRSPVTLGIQAATLNDLSGGRFLLGLGPSNPRIAGWHGAAFDRPLRRMREYVDIVQAVERGEKVEYPGETYATSGFSVGMAQVTDRMLAELPMVAATSVDEIRDRVRPYEEAGATRIIMAPVPCTADVVPEIKAFAEAW